MKADAKVVQHDLECQQECANPWLLVNSCNCRNHLADRELRPQEGPMEPQLLLKTVLLQQRLLQLKGPLHQVRPSVQVIVPTKGQVEDLEDLIGMTAPNLKP